MRNWLFIKFGGLIFGPKIFFGFVGNPTSRVKVHGKKKIQIVGSFNGISTTCKLEIDFFPQLRNNRCVVFT